MLIRIKATLVIVLVVFAIVAATFFSNASVASRMLIEALEQEQTVGRELADRLISADVEQVALNARSMSDSLKRAKSAAELAHAMKALLGQPGVFTGLAVFDRGGVLAASGASPAPASLLGDGRWLPAALGGKGAITTTMKDPATDELVFYVCAPMDLGRALVATVPAADLSMFFSDYRSWRIGSISVLDGEGTFIAHRESDRVTSRLNYIEEAKTDPAMESAARFSRAVIENAEGTGTYQVDGETRVCSYKRMSSEYVDWIVCAGVFVNDSPAGDIQWLLLISSSVILAVGAVGAYLVSGPVTRPYISLENYHNTVVEQSAWIKGELDRVNLMMEAMPLACQIWDRACRCIECNDQAVRLFRTRDKKEFFDIFLSRLSPERQPDGRASGEAAMEYITKAFETGRQHFEWMHMLADGTLMPADVSLVRVPYGDDYVVVGFSRDLREHKRMMGEIESALEEAKRANSTKTSFLANMSHEMRTPLNAILGMSELTLEADLDAETRANVEKIYAAGSMLLSTVNDILDISKIEAGKFEIINGDYDLPSTINDTVTQNIMRIGEKPIKFVLDIDGDLPARLNGDELRVKQVLNNLLSNAMKYTAQGTVELGVRCERRGGDVWVTIRVADTGVGIKPGDVERLFLDYSQFDKKLHRRIEGTGLGLPITKMVLGLMDGTIDVESEYGKGSVFTARFRQNFVSDETIGPKVAENLKGFRYSDSKRASGMRFVRTKLPYARVLVVDDIDTNLEVAKGLMKPYGMQVDCVGSGQQAVNAIRKGTVRYDAIFMDHMMPEMDGITATRLIRMDIGTEYAKKIPIIALTANAIVGNEKMFLDSGFQDFISKPIDLMRLDGVIKRWVRSPDHDRLVAEYEANAAAGAAPDAPDGGQGQGQAHSPLAAKTIDGIDIAKGIERFGSEEVYLKILRSYIETTQSLLGQLHLVDKDTLEDYAIRVHGIKGSSRGIGAFNVGDIAESLEHAAKAGDLDFVSKNTKGLVNAAGLLILNIQEALDEAALRSTKPRRPRPDDELLARLMEACAGYDMDSVDSVMSKIDAFDYDADDGLAAWLRENVAVTNFAQIGDRLSALLGK